MIILCTCCPRWVKTGVDTLWVRATAGGCRMILVTRLITGSRTDAGSLRIGDTAERTWESEVVAVFSSVLVGNLAWTSTKKNAFSLIIRTDTVVWLDYFMLSFKYILPAGWDLKSSSFSLGRKVFMRSHVMVHSWEYPSELENTWAESITNSMFFSDSGIASYCMEHNRIKHK